MLEDGALLFELPGVAGAVELPGVVLLGLLDVPPLFDGGVILMFGAGALGIFMLGAGALGVGTGIGTGTVVSVLRSMIVCALLFRLLLLKM